MLFLRRRALPPAAFLALLAIFPLTGCSATRPWMNGPLSAAEPVRYDGAAQMADPGRLPEVLVVANFSGGGSRSAAFAYAALAELEKMSFRWRGRQTNLARELDVVTGVSGGAVAAAHLSLFGLPAHLEHFPADFLQDNFQHRLVRSLLGHLGRAASPWYGRGNLLATELDQRIFKGATFGDLARLEGRPYLIVASTDLSSGVEFDFTADQLGLICSSIDQVPLAFAVAASSAVPALFSPLTLESHHRQCARPLPPAPEGADEPEERRYIHLVDGGVADDCGTHRIATLVAKAGGIRRLYAGLGEGRTPRRIVFLSVNSERRSGLAIDHSARVPGAVEVINAMLYNGLGRQSKEAAQVFGNQIEAWRRELAEGGLADGGRGSDIYDIHIKLDELDDPGLQRQVLAIPTSFQLSAEQIELISRAARAALGKSAELQRFFASVDRAAGP